MLLNNPDLLRKNFSAESAARIIAAVTEGASLESACLMVRIAPETLIKWMQNHNDFADELYAAAGAATAAAERKVFDDTKKASDWLKLVSPVRNAYGGDKKTVYTAPLFKPPEIEYRSVK